MLCHMEAYMRRLHSGDLWQNALSASCRWSEQQIDGGKRKMQASDRRQGSLWGEMSYPTALRHVYSLHLQCLWDVFCLQSYVMLESSDLREWTDT
jgi:hypothetical protein